MLPKPYYFQSEAIDSVRNSIKQGNDSVILCAPTGSGKSIIAMFMIKAALEKGSSAAILVYRKEILEQFFKLCIRFGMTPELVTPDKKVIPRGKQLYLGMTQTFRNRTRNLDLHLLGLDLIIIDESHIGDHFHNIKQIKARNKARIIGLTATPISSSQNINLNTMFDDLIVVKSVTELIKEKFLCDAITYSIPVDTKALVKGGRDYTHDSLFAVYDKPQVFHGAIENYKKYAEGRKFICYAVDTENSKHIAQAFCDAGIPTAHVDHESKDRKEVFKKLRSGTIQGIVNYGICTTGFDEPSVSCIIQSFSTLELSKHIQTAGRGARTNPPFKEDFIILDLGKNYLKHLLWNQDQNWSEIFHDPKIVRQREKEAEKSFTINECNECGAAIGNGMEECGHCGASCVIDADDLISKAKNGKIGPAELKRIREELKHRLPAKYRNVNLNSLTYAELKEYASLMGYKDNWANAFIHYRKKNYNVGGSIVKNRRLEL